MPTPLLRHVVPTLRATSKSDMDFFEVAGDRILLGESTSVTNGDSAAYKAVDCT